MTVPARPRPLPVLVALLLGVLCAFAAACGGDREGLLTAGRAESLREELDRIDEFVAAGRCDAARGRLASLRAKVLNLPPTTDASLRRRLREGVDNLEQQAPAECRDRTRTTETTPVPEPEPEPVPTTPPPTVAPEPTPTPAPTPTAPPEDDVPVDPGGAEAPSGAGAEELE